MPVRPRLGVLKKSEPCGERSFSFDDKNMKVGVLSFHYAINFGATLQLLSTVGYIRARGDEPIVINYIAADSEAYYERVAPESQRKLQAELRKTLWRETKLCRSNEDVARVARDEKLDAVIIGSDAVLQSHPWLERLTFPCRTIVGVRGTTTVEQFGNPLWGTWCELPMALISGSCQDSKYQYFSPSLKRQMRESLERFCYVSVRDEWTQKMLRSLKISVQVTPDPVFGFSQNASEWLPTKTQLLKKYNLPERYVVVSFSKPNNAWLAEFTEACRRDYNAEVLNLPMAHQAEGISPLDWYALIKNSQGYVGNNMHPIVVSLHEQVPFYSFDNYGLRYFNGLLKSDKSSKIKDILSQADLLTQRHVDNDKLKITISGAEVVERLKTIDKQRLKDFSVRQLATYNNMMEQVYARLRTLTRSLVL